MKSMISHTPQALPYTVRCAARPGSNGIESKVASEGTFSWEWELTQQRHGTGERERERKSETSSTNMVREQ